MAFPESISTDADLTKHAFVQGFTRILEKGESLTELHKGASSNIQIYLKRNGVPDPGEISNATDFTPAAAAWVVWQVLHGQMEAKFLEKAQDFKDLYFQRMKHTTPVLSTNAERGGAVAQVVVIKRGLTHYTTQRPNPVFLDYRE